LIVTITVTINLLEAEQ